MPDSDEEEMLRQAVVAYRGNGLYHASLDDFVTLMIYAPAHTAASVKAEEKNGSNSGQPEDSPA